MSELKQLKQLTPMEAANVGGGEGDCPVTVTLGLDPSVQNSGTDVTTVVSGTLIGTYEGIIQATSYAIERVINAVTE